MHGLAIASVGYLAQMLFSVRVVAQWLLSERKQKVVTPTLFWVFSLLGGVLMLVYGGLRHDFSILLGQTISYLIYIWNLRMRGTWQVIPRVLRWSIVLLPIVVAVLLIDDAADFFRHLFSKEDIPTWLLVFGSFGQTVFALRFVYQWWYSRLHGASTLPRGFWIQSIVGSSMILIYAFIRLDSVLILGQSFTFIFYIRNLMLGDGKKQKCNE